MTGTDAGDKAEKYLIFLIQGKLYAFPSRLIGEVAVLDKAYPLPLLPVYIKGIINRYSVPYALIDIGFLISERESGAAKVVVIKEVIDKLAFLIDDVIDIADVPIGQVLKVEQKTGKTGFSGIIEGSFSWHKTNVLVLSINEIINRIKKDFEE
jgi:purine-binding chemotaxis protein CheW